MFPDCDVGHVVKLASVGVAGRPGIPGVAGFGEVFVRGAVFPVIPLVCFFWELAIIE